MRFFIGSLCFTLLACSNNQQSNAVSTLLITTAETIVPAERDFPQLYSEITIGGLRQSTYSSSFERQWEENNEALYAYQSDGLNQYALIQKPNSEVPNKGYPVVLFGHGFHPDPPKYGVSNTTGKVSRPGDYYRGIPAAYAAQGFLTITPDYRGHNVSEGYEHTETKYVASSYYARDVLHALSALESLRHVDLDRVYYVGHSMGVDVGLKVLLATSRIKAASLWSGVLASTTEQVLFYQASGLLDTGIGNSGLLDLRRETNQIYTEISANEARQKDSLSSDQVDPMQYLELLHTPVIVHHAVGDRSAAYRWSESFVADLYDLDKTFIFYRYGSSDHLFTGQERKLAVARDVAFFESHR